MSVDHPLVSVPDSAPASARARARAIRIALIEDSPEYDPARVPDETYLEQLAAHYGRPWG